MAKRRRIFDPTFDPFGTWAKATLPRHAHGVDLISRGILPSDVWLNDLYQVLVYREFVKVPGWPVMHWLSIKRRDKREIHDWRDLQRIKNELIGRTFEAVELYPAESRLVDSSNQYHIFVLAQAGLQFPFGFTQRVVVKGFDEGSQGAKQRPWGVAQEPKDALTPEQCDALLNDALGKGAGPVKMPGYCTRAVDCDTCGATLDPHICGIGMVDGHVRRFPMYTGSGDVAAVGGPHPIEEGGSG